MQVDELMTREVRSCQPDDTVATAAQIMAQINVGAVPVVSGERLEGIVTDRDIVLKLVATGKDARNMRVAECMSREVVTVGPETDAHEAAKLMAARQIRRLPVVKDGRMVGIVALGDLATADVHVNEAGDALSEISVPAQPGSH